MMIIQSLLFNLHQKDTTERKEKSKMTTLTKNDLVQLGYGPSFSSDIIRQAKCLMVKDGFPYYSSRRLGRVPARAVETVLGYKIELVQEQTVKP